jgi:transposase
VSGIGGFRPGREDVVAKPQRRYPPELKERACRLVADWRKARQRSVGGFVEVGEQLDVHPETLRNRFLQWQIDTEAPGRTTEDERWIAELEAKVRKLERSNAILRSASAFFAAELDRPSKR